MHNFMKRLTIGWLLAIVALAVANVAQADPPSRVARLGYLSGEVSFAPAGVDEWVVATRSRPIVTGDRLWVAEGGRAELQMGLSVVRLNGGTSIALLNLDDRIAQLRVEQGTLDVRVRRIDPNDQIEIDTPNLAFAIRQPGDYRLDIDPNNNITAVVARSGSADVHGEGAAYTIAGGQRYAFTGTRLEQANFTPPPPDAFDAWAQAQDQRYSSSLSARYVAPEVIGYQDLDDQGTWRVTAEYGNAWFPRSVPANWAPYRYGYWAWIDPWGWTWVDDAPWGFAPFHYGRWAYVNTAWCWVPGPVSVRPIYAPAFVGFIGGSGFSLSVAIGSAPEVGWFPLGPGEIYRPAYQVSRNYFTNINTTNTKIVNVTNITNIYNNPAAINETRYVYRQQPTAVTAVPTTAFARAEPVGRARVQVNRDALMRASVMDAPAVAPAATAVVGPSPRATARPRDDVRTRPTVARVEPPPSPAPFAARQAALAANLGRPIATDRAATQTTAPGTTTPERSTTTTARPAGVPGARERVPIVMATPNTSAQPLPPPKAGEAPGSRAMPQSAEAPKAPEKSASVPPPRRAEAPPPRPIPPTAEAPKAPERAATAPPPTRTTPQMAEAPRPPERSASVPQARRAEAPPSRPIPPARKRRRPRNALRQHRRQHVRRRKRRKRRGLRKDRRACRTRAAPKRRGHAQHLRPRNRRTEKRTHLRRVRNQRRRRCKRARPRRPSNRRRREPRLRRRSSAPRRRRERPRHRSNRRKRKRRRMARRPRDAKRHAALRRSKASRRRRRRRAGDRASE